MMECHGHLDERLQKGSLRLLALQPDTLPVLVGQKEFLAFIAAKSVRKRSDFPVKLRASSEDYA